MSGIENDELGISARQKINAVIAREFETPAALIADNLLTYSVGLANTVVAGDTLKTRKGDHTYQVLASGASTFDLQTAGGVKLNLLPTDDNRYHFDGMNPTRDGTGDNLAKLQSLLNKTTIIGVGARIGPEIVFGYGTYAFSDTINLKSVVKLIGIRATFTFPAATAGIIVNRGNTFGAATDSSDPYGADTSEIHGIQLNGGRGSAFDETKSGIWLRARATVEDCGTANFAGHGLYGGAGSDGNPYLGNCNLSRVYKLTTSGNRGDGLRMQGTDANGGSIRDVNTLNNDGWGIYEASFLQNLHEGHHSLNNDLGSYYSTNNSVLLGSYAEDGNGANARWSGAMIGCMVTTHDAETTGQQLSTESANGPKGWRNTLGGFRAFSSVHTSDLGTEGNIILSSRHNTTGIAYPLRLAWETDATGAHWRWASSPVRLLNFNGSTTANTYGRSAAVGESLNIPSFFLGNGSGARYRGTGTAAPTTGTWARGDIIENINISSGSPMCWGCSVAGTPGTWIAGPNWP